MCIRDRVLLVLQDLLGLVAATGLQGSDQGLCGLVVSLGVYIYVECTPILQINTSDEIIFINSKEKGAAEKWYEKIV